MIEKRKLGKSGPPVGSLGYGAMVLVGYYGASDDAQAIETIRCALDAGMNMIDSADAYGAGHNESLVGRAIRDARPFGVDVSSGIEDEPGRKSAEKMRAFALAVRDADRAIGAAAAQEGAER